MRKLIRIVSILMFAVGIFLVIYPIYLKINFNKQTSESIKNFDEQVNNVLESNSGPASSVDYDALLRDMIKYNQDLFKNRQSNRIIDQLSFELPDFKLSDYGIQDEMFGYITIPSIDVNLPIYNGASESNMVKGAAHLSHTSLPVRGSNTNCVIAAHHRYAGISMFKRIVDLRVGDIIYITNFWERIEYKVIETKIIDPSESWNIYIQPNKELITLSTCYPFPYTTQRYLVYASPVKKNHSL